ncbi:MAG: LysR family transcriptional regulator [Neisseria sp.]|uniref:LysR family transcriptional regulator n=1 Tax=Neisseria sp. TaxID=192066 RepID=UPI0026DADD8F|nr:LysR family transcriptional regulator [Neisseria sp.]MDO4640389.1 LysR family transcriptional regulator [Neisseria sp.]
MDTLLSMKVFCQVVQSGSFTRAAEHLDISLPMASKHVSHLESSIQARLLYRNKRNLKLTEQGERYYQDCLLALDILEQAANQAGAGTSQPRGLLRLTAPVWFSNPVFAGWLAEYQARYPEVELMLTLTNRSVDLNSDGEDLALRMTNQLAENVIAKPLASLSFYLVAAPAYLEKHGMPQTPADLPKHNGILPNYTDILQTPLTLNGHTETLNLKAKTRTNNTLMTYHMTKAGAGIGFLPEWLIQEDLQNRQLIRLLDNYQIPKISLYAVYTSRDFLSAKVRSFIDFIAEKSQNYNPST